MKLITSILLVCTLPATIFTQNSVITGFVTDSLQNPVELANVMAYYKKDSSMASYGITDDAGRYRLIVKQGEKYNLKSSFIGYATWEHDVTADTDEVVKNIVLRQTSTLLNEVEIKYEFPITMSGDTIIYNADQFTTGNERKLGDVIETLPGFEIDENGDILVQGKKVNKVLVEGKEFFDGDSKMATENIPADAVDKIQLLRNYSDISPMGGLASDENLAINIKLDPDKKNLWFGDIETALGPQDRYLVHPNLFYYSPKSNINVIGDGNNIGQQAFTLRDYFRFSGGIRNVGERSGSAINLSTDELGISLMQNNMAQNIDSKLAAINFNFQPSKKWRLSAYGIASSITTLMNISSERTYVSSQESALETTTSSQVQESSSGLFKITGAYTPNYKAHIEYGAFIKTSLISEVDNRSSNFGQSTNSFTENDDKRPFSLDQNISGYFSLNPENIISVETSFSYKKQVPAYSLNTSIAPLQSLLILTPSEIYNIRQDRNITTNSLKSEVNHYLILNKTNHINFTIGINNSGQEYNSQLIEELSNGSFVSTSYGAHDNDVSFKYEDYYAGIHYKTKLGNLTLTPGFNGHIYYVSNIQEESNMTYKRQLLMPDIFVKYDMSSSKNIILNYNLNTQFTDILNIASRGVLQNYNSWFAGNRDLENILFHQVNLNYFNYNMFNHTNLYINTSYEKKYDDINESVNYDGTDRLSTLQNLPAWNDQLFVNASWDKKFVNLKVKTSARLIYNTYQNKVEQMINNNSSFTQEYTAAAESKFSNAPNFEFGFKKGWNYYETNDVNQEYRTNIPYADIEIPFLKSFTLIFDYEYTNYQNKLGTIVSNYDFLNATLFYEKDSSPWEYKFSVSNILETDAIRRDGFSNNVVSTFSYQVQPRYIILSLKYNL